MTDRKDGDEKGEYVNIQTNTDSIVNPGTIFKLLEDPCLSVNGQTDYPEMSSFDAFYKDYKDFKNYSRDILDARCTDVAAENELVSDEKESYSLTIKLVILEKKVNTLSNENQHLKGEIQSYQKVIQLLLTETSNNR